MISTLLRHKKRTYAMNRTILSTLTAFAALGIAVMPAARAQTSYTITDVGLLPDGMYSLGYGVNSSGQVTGRAATADGLEHAFLYTPGVGITDIGTLPGGLYSAGAAINNVGQITGYSYTSAAGVHPFLYSSAGMADLGTLGFGDVGEGDFGYGINSSGQVTGQVCVSNNTTHAFLYTTATDFQDLGTLGGTNSISYGINDSGQVTGAADTPTGDDHAFLYVAGTGMKDLGTLPGGTNSVGYAINSIGEVTGTAGASNGEFYAFLYSSGVMKSLGTLPQARDSGGYGVNSSGTVVGGSLPVQHLRTRLRLQPKRGYAGLERSSSDQLRLATGESDGHQRHRIHHRVRRIQRQLSCVPADTGGGRDG